VSTEGVVTVVVSTAVESVAGVVSSVEVAEPQEAKIVLRTTIVPKSTFFIFFKFFLRFNFVFVIEHLINTQYFLISQMSLIFFVKIYTYEKTKYYELETHINYCGIYFIDWNVFGLFDKL
jgi:hypothetical protein